MKFQKYFLLLYTFVLISKFIAQTPDKMSFQTVVRNNLGKLVSNKSIAVRLSVLKTSSIGAAVYVETHTKTSNLNGLLTLEVGNGVVTTGTFSTINWSQGPYFLKTEMDINGGSNYSIAGVTEFVSVPYAKLAENVKTLANGGNVGDMNYWNGTTWVPLNKGSQGQTLTFCEGKPIWTVGGVCPGIINTLSCGTATHNGYLIESDVAYGVESVIPYTGGNGGSHNGQVIVSTGVLGLNCTLKSGVFAYGNGSLNYSITGTPISSGIASFSINIGGKTCVFTREIKTVQSSGINFTSNGAPIGTFQSNISDLEGNSYKTVKIGNQVWMAENLKVTKFNDGTIIQNLSDAAQWTNLSISAWAYYNNDVVNNSKYGKLYNWNTVSPSLNGNKKICISGWHVPTEVEWTTLINFAGGSDTAGGMKEIGTTSWSSPNLEATNLSLFTALPGGVRRVLTKGEVRDTEFSQSSYWWSTSELSSTDAKFYTIDNGKGYSYIGYFSKSHGLSIRCVKD